MEEWAITLHDRVIKRFNIEDGAKLTIGRGSDSDVVIDNTAISRKHSSLELREGVYFLSDLKSTNGTYVNGKKIDSTVPIAVTDTINIGKFTMLPSDMVREDAAASSVSSSAMDMDDETVFVTSKGKPQSPASRDRSVKDRPKTRLSVVNGPASPKEVSLDGKTSVKIGKDSSCDIVLQGWFIAGAQSYIIKKDDKYIIIPQRSWVKTRLNGSQISDEHLLRKGDLIEIKNIRIRFE